MANTLPIRIVGPALMSRALATLLAGTDGIRIEEEDAAVALLHGRNWFREAGKWVNRMVCALLTDGDEEDLVEAHKCRIRVLIGVEEGEKMLASALHAAARGEPFCSPGIFAILQERAALGSSDTTRRPRGRFALKELTPREREIALGAAHGLSDQQIAALQCVQVTTVKTHLTHTYAKLGIRGRIGLQAFRDDLQALCLSTEIREPLEIRKTPLSFNAVWRNADQE